MKQWHNEPSPEHNDLALGDFFEGFIDGECQQLGLTHDDLRAWRPAPAQKRGRLGGLLALGLALGAVLGSKVETKQLLDGLILGLPPLVVGAVMFSRGVSRRAVRVKLTRPSRNATSADVVGTVGETQALVSLASSR